MYTPRTRSVSRAGIAAVVGLCLFTSACADDGSGNTDEPSADAPSADVLPTAVPSTDAPSGEVPSSAVPRAIVSLSPTATEMLYAIGAGDQVIAVDDFSNFPPEAAAKMQGLSGYTPNVEAIVGLEPDLVITEGSSPDLVAQLDALGIPTWAGPAASSFEDVYAQIAELGAATGHEDVARELVESMRAEVAAVKAALPALDEPLSYYHELDSTFYSVTSDTFIGAVYAEIGLRNIADEVGGGNPYPQLSAEFILAEDPDLIFLACTKYCGETAATLAARDGWSDLRAVRSGGVVEMDDDVASRWGPRIIEYLRIAGEAVAAVAG